MGLSEEGPDARASTTRPQAIRARNGEQTHAGLGGQSVSVVRSVSRVIALELNGIRGEGVECEWAVGTAKAVGGVPAGLVSACVCVCGSVRVNARVVVALTVV